MGLYTLLKQKGERVVHLGGTLDVKTWDPSPRSGNDKIFLECCID